MFICVSRCTIDLGPPDEYIRPVLAVDVTIPTATLTKAAVVPARAARVHKCSEGLSVKSLSQAARAQDVLKVRGVRK